MDGRRGIIMIQVEIGDKTYKSFQTTPNMTRICSQRREESRTLKEKGTKEIRIRPQLASALYSLLEILKVFEVYLGQNSAHALSMESMSYDVMRRNSKNRS